MTDNRAAAIEQIRQRREIVGLVAGVLGISLVLVLIWALTGAGSFWPIWAIGAMAVGLAIKAYDTYGRKLGEISEADIERQQRKNQHP